MEVSGGLSSRKESTVSVPSESQPTPVQITVLKAQDLNTLKSNVSVTSVCVEFNGVVLGESFRTNVLPKGTADYNFTTSFESSPNGPNSLNDIAQTPVLLTVIETLQKDKKQKDRTTPLGQAVVDLLPLLQGQCSFQVTAPLHAVPTSPSESLHPEAKGGLEVTVRTKEPLLSATQLSNSNFLSITLEAAYSIPETFAATGPLQNYMACLQVPAAGEKELPLLFKNGILKLAGEKEPLPRPKKWPLANIMAPGALSIPNSFIVGGPYEDEDGELTKGEDREFRIQAESMKRVVWDMESRCYLDPAAVVTLQKRIAECQYWPMEVCRISAALPSKGKTSKADKTKSQHSVFQDLRGQLSVTRMGSGTLGIGAPLDRAAPSKTQKEDKEKSTNKKMSHMPKVQLPNGTGEAENAVHLNLEGQQYVEAGTFLVMEIKLYKALVPRRLREELTKQVKQMIPPRPLLPPWTLGAQKAVEDYHHHITSIAAAILNECHELFGKQLPDQTTTDHQTLEEQKRQLNFELNSSGKYFAFKEQLKYAVVKIVREKYLKTTAFESQEQFQAFLSELYVYLMDQMHIALNQLLFEEAAPSAPPSQVTQKQLLLFAHEAQVIKDYKLASLYHQQRIAKDQYNVECWLDYGAFCLLIEETTKAHECFQQALSLDPNHIQSLLLCGITAAMLQHDEEAKVLFEDACCLEPSSVVAWTLSGLFYELQDNNIQAEMAFREAKKLLQAQLAKERSIPEAAEGEGEKVPDGSADKLTKVVEPAPACVAPKEEATAPEAAPKAVSPASGLGQPPCTIFMETVEFLMKANAVQFIHKALAHELLSLQGGPSSGYYLVLAQTYLLKEELSKCEECLCEAVRIDCMNPNVWAQKGHLCYLKKDFGEAKECYERTMGFMEDAADMHFVYLRLGSIYLEEKLYGRAKKIYLLACDNSASCLTWLGVGIACYRLKEMVEAEDALSEANALNNTNAEVWAYLSLICLHGGRHMEAEQCYKYVLKLGLTNDALLRELRAAQLRLGFGNPEL
ncbi:cilia- and flagella-associated protein 70 isoform X2 [Neopsephotus bourkii]|uniref:cilia- and flagella-associated protein 70 isoform X2 n=1 Tax=Neopsephotus bourkii TaxID=309878 RepID=UPI002AA51857|nr:cilia- and flagella-associated protein 70 isoform X2 [Neopsephotus bourkii]